jgi:hypothetical protein
MEIFVIFYGHLVSLCPFGLSYGHLVFLWPFHHSVYICFHFGTLHQEKSGNPAPRQVGRQFSKEKNTHTSADCVTSLDCYLIAKSQSSYFLRVLLFMLSLLIGPFSSV